MPPNILSFSGRSQSGKTMLAKVCEQYGYTIYNFADELKNIICQLLNIDIQELERRKDVKELIIIDIEYLETLLDFRPPHRTTFTSIRKLLQWLGTDVLRLYNPLWHICKVAKKIQKGQKIVFADCRFENELAFIRSIGGEPWYIARPWCRNESLHESEQGICRLQFGSRVLINTNQNKLVEEWKTYLEKDVRPTIPYGIERTEFIYPTRKDAYIAGVFISSGIEGQNCLYVRIKQNTLLYFEDIWRIEIPLIMVEDLKLWRVMAPMFVHDWLTGLIDAQNELEGPKMLVGTIELIQAVQALDIPRGEIYTGANQSCITWNSPDRLRKAIKAKHWKQNPFCCF